MTNYLTSYRFCKYSITKEKSLLHLFLKKKTNENNGKLSLYISKKADELKHTCNDQTFENCDKLCPLQPFLTNFTTFRKMTPFTPTSHVDT